MLVIPSRCKFGYNTFVCSHPGYTCSIVTCCIPCSQETPFMLGTHFFLYDRQWGPHCPSAIVLFWWSGCSTHTAFDGFSGSHCAIKTRQLLNMQWDGTHNVLHGLLCMKCGNDLTVSPLSLFSAGGTWSMNFEGFFRARRGRSTKTEVTADNSGPQDCTVTSNLLNLFTATLPLFVAGALDPLSGSPAPCEQELVATLPLLHRA